MTAPVQSGFIADSAKFALLGAMDLVGRKRTRSAQLRRMPKRRKNAVDPLQLKPGDYVVHARHGVAQFVKLAKRQLGGPSGTQREYVVLEYAPSSADRPATSCGCPPTSSTKSRSIPAVTPRR